MDLAYTAEAKNQVAPETLLASALRGFRQRAQSALDRLERINERFQPPPPRPNELGRIEGSTERPTHSAQIDRIEALLNDIHSQIDALDSRI